MLFRSKLTGKWASGSTLAHVGTDYAYARGAGVTASFEFTVPADGRYEVRFERSGFATVVRGTITLSSTEPTRLDVMLEVSSTQAVVVGSPAPVSLDRTHATITDTIPGILIDNLPVLGRGFLPLASLTAGFTGQADYPNPLGQQHWAHSVVVDSASHFSKWRTAPRAFGSGYSLDAIQQVQVLTSLFSAEFGGVLGSVTTATTRAGTNAWRGSAQLFARHASLDARPATIWLAEVKSRRPRVAP